MNPLILARIAGHSSLRMIDQVYSHLNTTDTYEAMLRMLNTSEERRR
jgi:integrase